MNIWFHQVDEVLILAPENSLRPINNEEAYRTNNLNFFKVPAISYIGIGKVLTSLIKLPYIFFTVFKVMQKADHIHLRCPGNISLIGCLLQVFFPMKPKSVKYAGNWDLEAKQPWTYRFQKWILSNTFLSRNIKVLVYGDWQNQSKNIVPFFTASFSAEEKESIQKDFRAPLKFIFTGNLVEGKGIFEAINLIEKLKNKGVISELDIYGDGVLEDSLRSYIQKKGLQNLVKLRGRKSLEELKQAYKKAHFVVLLSKSEGWPKALAEGMWYGCIPLAMPVSCVPWMLNYGERGILISNAPKGNKSKGKKTLVAEEEISRITGLLENPEKLKQMSIAAQEWSQQYTLEKFEKAIQEILGKHDQQPTTYNRELTADNSKQQTLNKPRTENPQLITDNPQSTTDNIYRERPNQEPLRVLQLIDSLRPGGAERMAVNTANSLESLVNGSFLCCTRQEGLLKEELKSEVGYIFLNKKSSLDPKAVLKLTRYIRKNKINIIHAHGTSWFLGVLMKLLSKVKLVWHDHYGESENLEARNIKVLKPLSGYFDGTISVNIVLKRWAEKTLKAERVIHLNNFIVENGIKSPFPKLKGEIDSFKIICVGNIRPQKDHLNLLRAFDIAAVSNRMISLHLIGEDPDTVYSKAVLEEIALSAAADRIFFYGTQKNISKILKQADLGILSSRSEGMPLALLEYGMAALPVVCTNVGQIPEVVGNAGILVDRNNPEELAQAILSFAENNELCLLKGAELKSKISSRFGENSYRLDLLKFYNRI
ncbi:glycosyltransferase [Salegentibacter mishustinae]|uniref:glycosyltransferase family 4 protein n=1 Tax=Salegentibacter mishustinae TaxID=270918 RepID=UPI001CE0C416|nr:glycosyltransferase [Salegentibacter mishustinae]UBZ07436.1 glycosyltransferase [Salegentibacter mishustinae]